MRLQERPDDTPLRDQTLLKWWTDRREGTRNIVALVLPAQLFDLELGPVDLSLGTVDVSPVEHCVGQQTGEQGGFADNQSSPGLRILPDMRPRQRHPFAHPGRARHARRSALATAALLLSLSGCSALDDVARGVRPAADDIRTLTRSKWVPPRLPPIRVAEPTGDEIVNEAVSLAKSTSEVKAEARKEVIDLACEAADYAEAQDGTQQDALEYLATRIPNTYANRQAAEDLIQDLRSALTSTDRVVVLGQAALCQWASS